MPVDKKFTKSAVAYEDPAKGPDHCGECEHFQKPNACEIVHGTISPDAWCRRFEDDDDEAAY